MKERRWITFLLALVLLAGVLPVRARAIDAIDQDREVSLTIRCMDGDVPLAGVEFALYRVADTDDFGGLTVCDAFRDHVHGDLNDPDRSEALARDLARAAADLPALDAGSTDARGLLRFPSQQGSLRPGLYLVTGQSHSHGGYVYTENPVLVMLPWRNQTGGDIDTWHYDVERTGKFDKVEEKHPVTVEVEKIWVTGGREKPESLTVRLYRDSRLFDEVILNENNGWSYRWEDLEPGLWEVDEAAVKGYDKQIIPTVNDERTHYRFRLVNTYRQPENPGKPPRLPQTGQLWWPVPVLLSAGLLLVLIGMLRRRGQSREN
ncbi:MAG: Cna B-type domain-containing protein [Eubacteriales bacterium]|nr:Cna B-type domain-containing protein [Eubacteriales bacterium]